MIKLPKAIGAHVALKAVGILVKTKPKTNFRASRTRQNYWAFLRSRLMWLPSGSPAVFSLKMSLPDFVPGLKLPCVGFFTQTTTGAAAATAGIGATAGAGARAADAAPAGDAAGAGAPDMIRPHRNSGGAKFRRVVFDRNGRAMKCRVKPRR